MAVRGEPGPLAAPPARAHDDDQDRRRLELAHQPRPRPHRRAAAAGARLLDALAPIVNPDEVRALFADPVVKKPATAWHLYTVSTLLTGLYPGNEPQDLDPVTVSRP